MNERTDTILAHMLEDALDVIAFCKQAGSYESFCREAMIRKATIMSLLNIGELASHLPQEFKDAHSEIPWRSMTGMRNFAAHGYHTMNLDTVWNTANIAVPELLTFLETHVRNENTHQELDQAKADATHADAGENKES